jgi:hypothetical protein
MGFPRVCNLIDMSDTPDPSIESDLLADAAPADTPVEVAEKLRWRGLLRFMKREGERRDRSMMINAAITIGTTSLVAFTAMYATLSTTNRNLDETRRGARVEALVEEWSVTVADASSAIELLGQRANDLWAYGAAIEQQGIILDEALANEATKETSYLKARQSLAFSSAKAGLVSSEVTNKCLDKFVAMLDTWQNALNWTRSSLQVEESMQAGINAVAMQQENRTALSDSLSIVRNLARTELDTAGVDGSSVKCTIPTEYVLWEKLIPSEVTE